MPRRVLSALSVLALCLCLATWTPATVQGQVSFSGQPTSQTPPPPSLLNPAVPAPIGRTPSAVETREVLDRGQALETERRWGEALTVYEDALRQMPRDPVLEVRMQQARMHYELSRRYNDASFKRSLLALPEREAMDLYAEVLLKVQSHYVDAPQWKTMIEHSAKSLQVALADPVFIEHNLPRVPAAQIENFRREVTQRVAGWQIANRHHARDAVAYLAKLGREQLGLAPQATILEFVCSATSGLDPYSTFLTADQLSEVYSQIEGNFVGLGVELKANEGSLLIVKAIPGSPAEKAGIHAGDRIVAVDGRKTDDLSTDQAANLLQGQEGTFVVVTVLAPDGQSRPLRIRRQQVEVPSIDGGRIVDADRHIAYLRLSCFQKTTARDLDTELWRLHGMGMESLILDLRGNPGGLLGVSVEVADRFVDNGLIVSTRGRGPQEDYKYTAHPAGTWRMPLVVLIDGDSASASEIFAGAIRDHHRGVIVGTRSYGKGSVQGIFPLNIGNTGLRLTTAKFYSPLNNPYSGIGVEPDINVRETAKPVIDADGNVQPAQQQQDLALEAAIQSVRQKVAKVQTSEPPR